MVEGLDKAAILIMTTLHKVLDKNQAYLYNTVGHTSSGYDPVFPL